jgi:hypothetical protein
MGVDDASCVYIPDFGAMAEDQLAATIANIIIAVIGILSLLYYGWHAYQSTCGWEEIYVCIVECKCCKERLYGGSLGCSKQLAP